MAGELIPQIVTEAAERRGSVDEIVTRWIAQAYQPQPIDLRKLWADHYAVADYWQHKARHPLGHAGAMIILYQLGTAADGELQLIDSRSIPIPSWTGRTWAGM